MTTAMATLIACCRFAASARGAIRQLAATSTAANGNTVYGWKIDSCTQIDTAIVPASAMTANRSGTAVSARRYHGGTGGSSICGADCTGASATVTAGTLPKT